MLVLVKIIMKFTRERATNIVPEVGQRILVVVAERKFILALRCVVIWVMMMVNAVEMLMLVGKTEKPTRMRATNIVPGGPIETLVVVVAVGGEEVFGEE